MAEDAAKMSIVANSHEPEPVVYTDNQKVVSHPTEDVPDEPTDTGSSPVPINLVLRLRYVGFFVK